jgi:CHAT domain-containing protein/tetratricopeptide (TPR) repeat protein
MKIVAKSDIADDCAPLLAGNSLELLRDAVSPIIAAARQRRAATREPALATLARLVQLTPADDAQRLGLGRVLLALGRDSFDNGRYGEALEHATAALAQLEANPAADTADGIAANRAAGLAAWYAASPFASRPYYAAAAALVDVGSVPPATEARVFNDLALCAQKLGDLETSRAAYERAFAAAQLARLPALSREIARRLSTLAIDQGQLALAGERLQAARPPSRSPILERLRWHHAMAMWAELDLQLDLAEMHFERSVALFERAPDACRSAMGCVPNTGLLKLSRDKLGEAVLLLRQAKALDQPGAPADFRLALFGLEGRVAASREGIPAGLFVLKTGIAHFGSAEQAAPHRAAALVLQGAEMLVEAGDDEAATSWLGDWLQLSVDAPFRPLEDHEILLALLWAGRVSGEPNDALAAGIVAMGLSASAQGEEENLEGLTLLLMARRARSTGHDAHAIMLAKLAGNLLLGRAGTLGAEDVTARTVLRMRYGALSRLRADLIEADRIVEARQVLEAMRLRASFDLAHGRAPAAAQALTLTDDEAPWATRYAALRDTGRHLVRQYADWSLPETVRNAAAVSFETVVADLIRLADQPLVAQPSAAPVPSLRGSWARAIDPPGGAVLRFHQSSHDTIVEVSRGGDRRSIATGLGQAQIGKLVAGFVDAVFDRGDVDACGRLLYSALLGPAEGMLEHATQLELVVDGALAHLPFAALHDGRSYLVERLPIAYRSGVGGEALPAWQQPSRIALFANDAGGGTLEPLPFVRKEVANISAIFVGAARGVSSPLFSRGRLAAELRARPDILHIASHFQLTPGSAERSRLLLHGGRQLAVAELARPDLRWAGIQLLFLSACDAGAFGAEAESLATMFHRLGIQRLIASLWPVFDDATARLVARFYGAIAAGDEPASALRQAQAAVIALSGKAANRCLRDWCSFKLFVPGG